MEQLLFSEVVSAVAGRSNVDENIDIAIKDIVIDTRKITKGSLFIAIKGENFDGHDFIEKAFELGAVAAISQKEITSTSPIIYVDKTRIALGKIAAYFKAKIKPITVGITGSVGKTSTKEMIYEVMAMKYNTLKTQGNLNNDIGLPLTLLELNKDKKAAIIEMGMSDLGEISYLSQLAKPDIAVITNVGVSHLENLKTRENILKAKLEILDGMTADAKIILNADNDMLFSVKNKLGQRAIYVGIEQDAQYKATNIIQQDNKTYFDICYNNISKKVMLPTIGVHNVYNALLAYAVGVEMQVDEDSIIKAIAGYKNAKMRQNIREYNGIIIVEDCYNASPDSMQSAINVISQIDCKGKRYAVLGSMLELGEHSEQLHRDIGKMVSLSKIDELLTYGEEASFICKGAIEAGYQNAKHFDNKEELSQYIKTKVKANDSIIFKGSRGIKLEEIIQMSF